MLSDHEELNAVVTAVASVGFAVDINGHEGFIDQVKHPSWWTGATRPVVGDRLHTVVLDASRTPPRLSALPEDIRVGRSLRYTDPLIRACPPPSSARRPVDWPMVQERLGTALPADYKRLIEVYGGGVFSGVLWLMEPGCPDEMYDLLAQTVEREEILADLWAVGEAKPAELEQDGARLVPWGYSENGGEVLYWLALPGVLPEEWPVILNEGRGPLWEFHPTSSCSRFLLEVCTGSTGSYYFSDLGDFVSPSERGAFLPHAELIRP
ncbi:SMI1/KNR4 family protein [Streptomyces sp. NPDC048269]|uniref:SMI1/KNR4 family protein n=1 Tax=Streptomyces sp. NPDC048269 TaxID=3155753 RepID=UPI003435444D